MHTDDGGVYGGVFNLYSTYGNWKDSLFESEKYNNVIRCSSLFKAPPKNEIIPLDHFYWGTTNSTTFQTMVYDFWKDINLAMFNFQPYLSAPSDSAHGMAWKVLVDGIDPQDQKNLMSPIGVGVHRFDVYFNRPMEITSTPQLSFGVRSPFTQQAVSDSASWSPDHRIWTAYKTIKLYTGDGINTISVAGAKDPDGFNIPIENMRFQFLIDAAGTSSLDFTATPGIRKDQS